MDSRESMMSVCPLLQHAQKVKKGAGAGILQVQGGSSILKTSKSHETFLVLIPPITPNTPKNHKNTPYMVSAYIYTHLKS